VLGAQLAGLSSVKFRLLLSRFLGVARNKRSSKTETTTKTFFKKVHLGSGLITKNLVFYFPSVVLRFARFFLNRVFGRFVTRGVQKRDKNKTTKTFRSRPQKYLLALLVTPPPPPPPPSRRPLSDHGVEGVARGRQKQKSVTPVVGGWVRVRKRDRVRFIFLIFFYRVFELPSPRNAPKQNKKKSKRKSVLDFWSNFL
jgi:hypothetical protein